MKWFGHRAHVDPGSGSKLESPNDRGSEPGAEPEARIGAQVSLNLYGKNTKKDNISEMLMIDIKVSVALNKSQVFNDEVPSWRKSIKVIS